MQSPTKKKSSEPLIREYKNPDMETVLNLLKLNTPKFFAPDEEKDLIHYLENETEHYFIIEFNDRIVGSGGFNFAENKTIGIISWDILHPDFQGRSFGTALLNYRIRELQQFKELKKIIVRTSQLAYKFYEKAGFRLLDIVEDHWAKGFHMYRMEYTG
jgi:ribosomal-protein-alanine N-acetyltransferase